MQSTPAYARNCPASDDQPPDVPGSDRHTAGSHVGNHDIARLDSRFDSAGRSMEVNGPTESVRGVLAIFVPLAKWSAGCAASTRKTFGAAATAIGGPGNDRATGVDDSP